MSEEIKRDFVAASAECYRMGCKEHLLEIKYFEKHRDASVHQAINYLIEKQSNPNKLSKAVRENAASLAANRAFLLHQEKT